MTDYADPQVRFAAVSATADGDNTVITAKSGFKIRVLGYVLVNDTTAGIVTFKDGSAAIGAVNMTLRSALVFAGQFTCPAFECAGNFVINNGVGVDTTGHITYVFV